MNAKTKNIINKILTPYIFYGISFSIILLHYLFTNTITGTLYLFFMTVLFLFFVASLLSIFMMRSDPAVVQEFVRKENSTEPKYKIFKQIAGVSMLYLFLAFNWVFSFIIWLGVLSCMLFHSHMIRQEINKNSETEGK